MSVYRTIGPPVTFISSPEPKVRFRIGMLLRHYYCRSQYFDQGQITCGAYLGSGMEVCNTGPCHLTKMAIRQKIVKKF